MRSTTGQYFQGLDHLRALAVFLVFSWHFLHFRDGHLQGPSEFAPLSLLTEGHTGVALFMALSGYLFAKLLNGKKISYSSFLINRSLRLLPLLLVVVLITAISKLLQGDLSFAFIKSIAKGLIQPTLPNGGWSITVEFHFYLILPFLLVFLSGSWLRLFGLLAAATTLRLAIWAQQGEVQSFAYWTILGRFDQFLLGIAAYQFRIQIRAHPFMIAIFLTIFVLFWWTFDSAGGFYKMPSYPSPSLLWVFIPTIEGLAYALLIVWYDSRARNSSSFLATKIAAVGTHSYSIYLLHFFFVFELPIFINKYIVSLESMAAILITLPLCFLLMLPIGWASYNFLETPFLKRRRSYFKGKD